MIIICTPDGTFIARCTKTGAEASGPTKETAAAELRRKIGARGKKWATR